MQIQTGARSYASAAEMRADYAERRRRLMDRGVMPEQMPAEPDPPVVLVEAPEPVSEPTPEVETAAEPSFEEPRDLLLVSSDPQILCPSIGQIKVAVCSEFQITMAALDSRLKSERVVIPRQIAIAVARHLSKKSYPIIGRSFRREHTTVMHAVQKMRSAIKAVAPTMSDTATAEEWIIALRALVTVPGKRYKREAVSQHFRAWQYPETMRAKMMRDNGATYEEIGRELGRTLYSVRSRLREIKMTPEQQQRRLEQVRAWKKRQAA